MAFHQDEPSFSLTAPSVAGVGPSPLAGAGAAPAAPELTKNATTAPNSSTSMAIGDGNHISNLTPLMGFEVQEFTANAESDVPSAAISDMNHDD